MTSIKTIQAHSDIKIQIPDQNLSLMFFFSFFTNLNFIQLCFLCTRSICIVGVIFNSRHIFFFWLNKIYINKTGYSLAYIVHQWSVQTITYTSRRPCITKVDQTAPKPTRNSALLLTNREISLDVRVKVTKHGTIPYVAYGLLFYSNFVPKMHRF